MPIGPGTCLGPHEIQSATGAGGMGEVYRARDTALGDVAIKTERQPFQGETVSDVVGAWKRLRGN